MTFLWDVKIDLTVLELPYVKFLFMDLIHSPPIDFLSYLLSWGSMGWKGGGLVVVGI